MPNNNIRLFVLLVIALLQFSCATESAPTGGKEDLVPPKLKKALPENYSTSFSAQEIKLSFNEFIEDKGFPLTLTSPVMDPPPTIRVNGKTLSIKLKATLLPNTTYTINFGNDIKDYNRGNPVENFKYVFSTGSYIDSAKVYGKILNTDNEKESENILVALYPIGQENPILIDKPSYFCKTDKSGNYSIENVKAGSYQLFCLKDQNFNFIYDQPNELVGFSNASIIANDTAPQNINLSLFKELPTGIKLQSLKSVEPGKILLCFNRPFETLKLDSKLFEGNFSTFIYPSKDTAIIWFSNHYTKKDSVFITTNDTLKSSMSLDLKTVEKDSILFSEKYSLRPINQSFKLGEKVGTGSSQNANRSLILQFPRPLIEINNSKRVEVLTDTIKIDVVSTVQLDKENPQKIIFSFPQKPETAYTLNFPDSMFRDIFATWNKSFQYRYTTSPNNAFGNIILKTTVENPSSHYLLQLLNTGDEVVEEMYLFGKKTESAAVKNIPSGVYHIRVIEDNNANGKWDTGSLLLRQQPEKIIQMPGTHTLKGGWDLEIEVKL